MSLIVETDTYGYAYIKHPLEFTEPVAVDRSMYRYFLVVEHPIGTTNALMVRAVWATYSISKLQM